MLFGGRGVLARPGRLQLLVSWALCRFARNAGAIARRRAGGRCAKGKEDLWELYNSGRKAGEVVNRGIFEQERSRAARESMIALRTQFRSSGVSGGKTVLDAKTIEALRSLGYVE